MNSHVQQHPGELAWFADLLAQEGVRSYLEIGAKYGGSVAAVAARLPAGATIVAVDLPYGTGDFNRTKASLENLMAQCRAAGMSTHIVWGNSTDPKVVEAVHKLGPFDAVFIDADHTMPYVTADFGNYGPMANIVAFHDIGWPDGTRRIDVPKFWREIKATYRHEECKLDPSGGNGIGVLWRL